MAAAMAICSEGHFVFFCFLYARPKGACVFCVPRPPPPKGARVLIK
jgi:hypothetical protein